MLKAYAVALVLSTSTPTVDKQLEGVQAADLKQLNQTQITKERGGKAKGKR